MSGTAYVKGEIYRYDDGQYWSMWRVKHVNNKLVQVVIIHSNEFKAKHVINFDKNDLKDWERCGYIKHVA